MAIRPIYLDHMASTPLDPEVSEAMLPWLAPHAVGNPHSAHAAGWRAAEAIEGARAEVAALLNASPGEVLFTSGATEANNLALFGASRRGGLVIASMIEHPSVLAGLAALRERGRTVRTVPVDPSGRLEAGALEAMLDEARLPGGTLISIMAANHEVGTLQPLADVVRLARRHGARVHTDASQALATQALDVRALDLDLLTLSGHKLYGPQGVGALWVRDGVRVAPVLFGGGQQGGIRPGTLPVALIVGLGAACRIIRERRVAEVDRLVNLRERLWQGLRAAWPAAVRNGREDGVPHCLSVTFPGLDAEDLLLDLPELCLSTGSACATGEAGPSPVLLAMGRTAEAAHGTIRFGLGRFTAADEVDRALRQIGDALAHRSPMLQHA